MAVLAGGSAGHSDLWAVDITEGTASNAGRPVLASQALCQRRTPGRMLRPEKSKPSGNGRKTRTAETLDNDRRELVKVVARRKTPQTKTDLRERATLGHGQRFDRTFASLTDDGIVGIDRDCQGQQPARSSLEVA